MKKMVPNLGLAATFLLAVVGLIVGKQLGRDVVEFISSPDLTKTLEQASARVNRDLPRMLDPETRLERTFVGPGARFTYVNVLVNYPADGQNFFDIFDDLESGTLKILSSVCGSAGMAPMLDSGTEVVYEFRDKANVFLFDVKIRKSDCARIATKQSPGQ